MKIAVGQINTIIGDLEYNKQKILDAYAKGIRDGADIIILPELALTGYPPLDLLEKREFRLKVMEIAEQIASRTGETALIFGSITEDDDLIGTDIHNSALLCFKGQIQFIQHKSLIPNYDVFDEMRYFEPAKDVGIVEFRGEKLGISICEDIWNDEDYWYKRRYIKDPVKSLIDLGATIIINISASPYAYGKREERRRMLSTISKKDKVAIVYTCIAGAQTELIFDGASMCFNINGELVLIGKTFDEDYLLFNTDTKYKAIADVERSFEEEVLEALIYGLREYCTKTGHLKVIVGLSGGLDSAIVTYIAAKAIGAENTHVLLMPSEFSSEGSITDSQKLIANLGISSDIVSIQPVFESAKETLKQAMRNSPEDVTEENIQARIRGMYLMAMANKFNYLLLTTGNKSEIAVGYATLYGDMAGALAVIGDVYKSDIYRIAEYINRDGEIIPYEIIGKAPSAELRHGQTDQDSLPPYELLDRILRFYLEENKELSEIAKLTGEKEVVEKVLKMVDYNEFKRRQAAPVLKVSKKSFGFGRRYPVVQGWRKFYKFNQANNEN
jgi:NAD+ synthase (glutamine-hydrolysing)